MATVLHDSPSAREKRQWASQLLVSEMWASLAISVMWVAVLFDAIFGPDLVSSTYSGDHTTVPSAIFLALFAFLGTWVVARHGFGRERTND